MPCWLKIKKITIVMKKILLFAVCMMLFTVCDAQEKKFSPEKFEAELADYVRKEAKLSDEEAGKYFPLLREMHKKQRCLYNKKRDLGKEKPSNEERCAAAIRERDKLEIELKQIEQCYHKKMMQVISASKLYECIRAENQFHRKKMKGWQKGKH